MTLQRPLSAWWLLASLWLTLLVTLGLPQRAQAQTFLPPEQAFRLTALAGADGELVLEFLPAKGVYLYKERMGVEPRPASVQGTLSLPDGERKYDETFAKEMEIYHGPVTARWRPQQAPTTLWVAVNYQGCADAGLCYPPQKKHYKITVEQGTRVVAVADASATDGPAGEALASGPAGEGGGMAAPAAPIPATASDDDAIGLALASGSLWRIVGAFLLAGVLLSLTPCVLPMVPILSSIIIGHGQQVGRGKGFALALAYSQGMALVYTGLGVAAGLLGQGLAAYLQHPAVLMGFAALMVLLSLSMFGLYELRLPAAVQTWLGEGTNRLPGGQFISVFAMGAVSALVVSPCVSAPLAGALLYISQTGDVVLGGTALYAMAWGMSVPLLLVGLSAGQLLPRTGPWMTAVKGVFGVLMLGMALWIARPAWPYVKTQWLGMDTPVVAHQSALPFQKVRTVAELDAALAQARQAGQPVMLDFYADWCVACLEMEQRTFTDPGVQAALQPALMLQADVTANTADDQALLKRFGLFGPPGIVFYNAQGQEVEAARVIGFQAPAKFMQALKKAGL
ncbi:protein-disulfide reductase DsbD [Aquabacterium lacunae]|uniref:Protein-disulfide reductase DsbD n=1 Tax=Aquabacterium lacunae TaxID=2528630 RepID=A0A4Q9GYR6_9BURK|nr:protein-disulfide reductase DsbD [Aquabacterium lacunae]TBO31375.1 protein-disulfide reductase DsbD [Aquabacterium lacunae]